MNVYYLEMAPLIIYLCVVLVCAAISDIITRKIPNLLTYVTVLIGIGYHAYFDGLTGMAGSLAGLAAGIGFLIIFYLMGGMGAGDVKLMGAVGAVLGVKGAFFSFLLTAFYGGVYSFGVILVKRQLFKGFLRDLFHALLTFILIKKYDPVSLREAGDKPRLYYGVAIALGTMTYIGLVLKGYWNAD